MAITPDGYQIAAAGYQHIHLYDLVSAGAAPVMKFEGVAKNVSSVQFDRSGNWMFTGGEDCSAKMWDIRTKGVNCSKIFQVTFETSPRVFSLNVKVALSVYVEFFFFYNGWFLLGELYGK